MSLLRELVFLVFLVLEDEFGSPCGELVFLVSPL
jgi:hypothetical protein